MQGMRALPRGSFLLALVTTLALAPPRAGAQEAPPVPGGPPARALFTIKAEKGFIDDPFAISTKAGALAVLLTDAASFARIDLIDLSTGKPRRTVELGDPQRLFEEIYFATEGGALVLVSRDAGSGRRSAQYFDERGKAAGLLGPLAELGVSRRGPEPSLVATTRTGSAGRETTVIARHRLAGLGRVGKPRSVVIDKRGEVREPPLKGASFLDSNALLVGLSPGGYDKARDIRLPDQSAVYDVLAGNFVAQSDVGDVVAFAAAAELRRKFPGRGLFAIVSPDTRLFELIDWQGRRGPLELPVPLRYYDATTLVEAEDPATPSLLFSLAIDPLHPEALARRKKDPTYLDLYWARPAAPKAAAGNREPLAPTVTRLLRAPNDDRPTAWTAAGGHAAVLRKHKNFSRGGALLEVYPLEKNAPE
jgi:hypothetical protein